MFLPGIAETHAENTGGDEGKWLGWRRKTQRKPRNKRTISVLGVAVLSLALLFGCKKTEDREAPTSKGKEPAEAPPEQPVSPAETPTAPEESVPAPSEEPVVTPGETPPVSLPADFKNYTETITAFDGVEVTFEMIAVPGGTFTMGSPVSEKGRKAHEGPQRKVTVGPFWIGKTEVTWDEFETFGYPYRPKASPWMEEYVDGETRPTLPYGDSYRSFGRDGKPVVGVSWYAGMVYCRWLSRKTGKMYRLPTEAEWEYACRAGSTGKYCFGDDESQLREYAWYTKNAKNSSHKVGTRKPNAWGIYDMHGNLAEWCLDYYADKYPALSQTDPQGPPDGKYHVFRGGSWQSTEPQVRSARRDHAYDWWFNFDPQEPKSHWWLVPANHLGFRIVRPLKGEEPPFPSMQNGL